jgi:hypothetical protein
MNKYKVILETYVEAEDVLSAMWKGFHKLDPLGDTQFQFEVIDVHQHTSSGWESSSGIVKVTEKLSS